MNFFKKLLNKFKKSEEVQTEQPMMQDTMNGGGQEGSQEQPASPETMNTEDSMNQGSGQ